jgi:hypothetical protein
MRGISLVVGVVGDVSNLQKSLGGATKSVKGFGGVSLGAVAGIAGVAGVAVVAGEALYGMAKAADADRTEQKKLEQAIINAGAATGDYMGVVDAAIAQGQEKAFSDSETRAGLESLVTATGDVTEATALLGPAMDIARMSGVSLEQASDAIAKAHTGQDGALRKLLPGLEKGATGMDTVANATKLAAGQADIFAASSEGSMMKAGDAFGELGEEVGSALLPILDMLIPVIIDIVKVLSKLIKAVLPILTPFIHVLAMEFKIFAGILTKVIGFVSDLISWLLKLMKPITDALDGLAKLNPFGDIIGMVTGGGFPSATTGGINPTLNATFNIYGDPAIIERTVVTTLRDYSRRNGYETLGLAGRER